MKSTIDIKTELFKNGYCIIPGVLTNDEVQYAKSLFKEGNQKFQIMIKYTKQLIRMEYINSTKQDMHVILGLYVHAQIS